MKPGWEKTTLGELCKIARGGSPRPIEKFMTDDPNGINWIKIGDATRSGKYIYETREKITQDGVSRSRMVHEGDFLLSNSMSFGRPYVMKTSGCIHDGWLVLTPDTKRSDQDFLYHLLGSPQVFQQFDALAAGSTVRNLNIGLVERVKIPLPPLHEQKRIIEVLDAAFEGLSRARAHTETNLQNARELFETTLEQIFSAGREIWQPKVVSELGSIQTGSTPKTNDKANFGNFLPFVKPADFNQDGSLNYTDDGVSEQGAKQSRLLRAGSVLMVCIGATIGKVGYSTRGCVTNQQVNALTPNSDVDCKFIYYQMRSRNFQEQVLHASGQATLPIINKSKWSALTLFIPPTLEEQKSIVEQLDTLLEQFGSLQSHYRAKLADLDALRQALLQKAFAGELT